MPQALVAEKRLQPPSVGDLDAPMITLLGSLDDGQAIDSLRLDETPKTTTLIIYKPF